MEWDYHNFTKEEMSCRCGCGLLPLPALMTRLQSLRTEMRFPFIVTSGARCPEYNNEVSDTGFNGPHTLLLAVDIKVYGKRAYDILSQAHLFGFTGIGFRQHGDIERRFMHLDCIIPGDGIHPRPTLWTYK